MRESIHYLQQKQSLPLELKIILSKRRITEWYTQHNGQVYVSVSGKDSTVLLHIVRSLYPEVPAVSVNTGIEHPENIKFLLKNVKNITWLKPRMSFQQVIGKYGYPVVSKMTSRKLYTMQNPTSRNRLTQRLYMTGINSKGEYHSRSKIPEKWKYLIKSGFKFSHKCCDVMKKYPIRRYEKETFRRGFVGTMACESAARRGVYLKTGCNNYNNNGYSKPLSFWLEQDILRYISNKKLQISKAYGEVNCDSKGNYSTTKEKRTGCIFCLFGCHLEKEPNRIQRLKKEYPELYYFGIREKTPQKNGLGLGKIMKLLKIPYE